MISAIVCVDRKWGIGKKNGLLFHLPIDMRFFKEKTTGHAVVMGENTLLSFPGSKPLKNRVNVVLCPEGHEYEGCATFHDFGKMLAFIKALQEDAEVFVIGGAMTYKSMLPYCDRAYVTKVDADGEAEVFFPNLDELGGFRKEKTAEAEDNGLKMEFWQYDRL